MPLSVGQGDSRFAGMGRMPAFHCKYRSGVKLVSGFNTVHVGGPSPPVNVHGMRNAGAGGVN